MTQLQRGKFWVGRKKAENNAYPLNSEMNCNKTMKKFQIFQRTEIKSNSSMSNESKNKVYINTMQT